MDFNAFGRDAICSTIARAPEQDIIRKFTSVRKGYRLYAARYAAWKEVEEVNIRFHLIRNEELAANYQLNATNRCQVSATSSVTFV